MIVEENTYDFFLLIAIGDLAIPSQNIELMVISMDLETKLPVMRLIFDTGSVIQRNAPIQDGSTINVVYGINENTFKKTSFTVRTCVFAQSPGSSTSYIYTISAVLNVNDHKAETSVFESMSSDKVAESIALKHDFEFINETDGNDEMTWLQASQDDWSFLKDVEEHAYAKDYDSVVIFPDIWGTLTYSTLKTQLSNSEKTAFVTEGNEANLEEFRKQNFLVCSNYKMVSESGLMNSISAYGSRVSMHDDAMELDLQLRDLSSPAKNINRKADFAKDLAANFHYGYQPTSVHGYYLYAKAVNDYLRLSFFTELIEIQCSLVNHTEEQTQMLLDMKPSDCVHFLPAIQSEDADPVIAGKYVIKRTDIHYSRQDGLNFYFLIGRNGLNLTDEYQGVPSTSQEKGEEEPSGVQAMGSNPTEELNGKQGPLAVVAEAAPSKNQSQEDEEPPPDTVPASRTEIEERDARLKEHGAPTSTDFNKGTGNLADELGL